MFSALSALEHLTKPPDCADKSFPFGKHLTVMKETGDVDLVFELSMRFGKPIILKTELDISDHSWLRLYHVHSWLFRHPQLLLKDSLGRVIVGAGAGPFDVLYLS